MALYGRGLTTRSAGLAVDRGGRLASRRRWPRRPAGARARQRQGAEHAGRGSRDAHQARRANRCLRQAPRPPARRLPGAGAAAPRPAAASGAPQPLYWGATIGSHLTGDQAPWDMSAVTKFEESASKSASMVQFFQPFANCGGSPCSFYAFPTDADGQTSARTARSRS